MYMYKMAFAFVWYLQISYTLQIVNYMHQFPFE